MSFAAVARKELRDILRERTILVAIVVQLFIAGFSTFLTVGLTGLYDPESVSAFPRARIAYVGPEGDLLDALEATDNLRVQAVSLEAATLLFQQGRLDAVLALEPGDTHNVTLLLRSQGIQTTLLTTQLKAILIEQELELRQERQERLATPVLSVDAEGEGQAIPFAFAYATLLPLLVLTPVFLAGATAADSFVQEVHTRTLLILRSGPIGMGLVLAGKTIVPVLLAPLQVLLWCGLLWANGLPVANLGWILVLSALMATLLAAIGIAVSAQVKRNGQAQAGYALVGLAVGVASLFLPRNPMNTIALLATGTPDVAAWATLGIIAVAAAVVATACLTWTSRRIRQDKV